MDDLIQSLTFECYRCYFGLYLVLMVEVIVVLVGSVYIHLKVHRFLMPQLRSCLVGR